MGTLMVRMPEELEAELRRVAAAQRIPIEPAELMRWAAEAIVECHKANGSVPRDLAVTQRIWHQSESESLPLAAEPEGSYGGPIKKNAAGKKTKGKGLAGTAPHVSPGGGEADAAASA